MRSHSDTSREVKPTPARAEGAGKGEIARRFATKSLGTGAPKRADLSRTKGFVPTFLTKEAISLKLSDEEKKLACFVSKTHSRRGSTQLLLPCLKSFFLPFKASVSRIFSSFFCRYISFGFLGRTSAYWTEATTRTHKVTKPLIWTGIFLASFGAILLYRNEALAGIPLIHAIIALVLVVNGLFLSFKVSPYLLAREKEGKSRELLPRGLQRKIMVSLIVSDIGWWSGLFFLVVYVLS